MCVHTKSLFENAWANLLQDTLNLMLSCRTSPRDSRNERRSHLCKSTRAPPSGKIVATETFHELLTTR